MLAVKVAVAMLAVVGAMVAVASAANLPRVKPARHAKAVAEAKVELKAVMSKPDQRALNAQSVASALSEVNVPLARAVAIADPKCVLKAGSRVGVRGAATHAQKPAPMRHQSSMPMAPKCARNVHRVKVAANEVSVAVKDVVSVVIGANVAKPMRLALN